MTNENERFLGSVMMVVGAVILVPMVIQGALVIVDVTYRAVGNGVNKIAFKRKIKKGLKDGSIVEINREYFEVEVNPIEEA